jgi:hypothetical protein
VIEISDLCANLDRAWDFALANNPDPLSLRAVLRQNEDDARSMVGGGGLMEVEGNGRRSKWSLPAPENITPVEQARLWRELIALFDRQKFILQQTNPTPTDLEIYTAMAAFLAAVLPSIASPIDEFISDYSLAGCR